MDGVAPPVSGRSPDGARSCRFTSCRSVLGAASARNCSMWPSTRSQPRVLADNVPAPAFYERRGLQLLERENVDEIAGELLREACYAKSLG